MNGTHLAASRAAEVYSGGTRVAVHRKALIPGTVVPLAGQWDGVPLGTDQKPKQALATRVLSPEVEVRALRTYEALAEVSGT